MGAYWMVAGVLLVAIASNVAAGPDGGAIIDECVAFAPIVFECDVGVADLDGTIWLGYTIYPCPPLPYPASCLAADLQVVSAQLDPPFAQASATCSLIFLPGYNFIDEPDGCRFPQPRELAGRAQTECHARRLHTVDPDVPGSGETLGAAGEFGCFVANR